MTLVRVNNTVRGGFTLLNVRMVTRMKCSGFDGGAARAPSHRVLLGRWGVQLVGEDVDWVLSELEDLTDATSD